MGRDKGTTHDGKRLLDKWEKSGLGERAYWRANLTDVMSYDAFHGRLWRAKKGYSVDRAVFQTPEIGAPFRLPDGQYMIVGDLQLPTSDIDYIGTMLAVAEAHLPKPRTLIIAGDFINADAFSTYDSDVATPSFEREMLAAELVMDEFLTVFSEVYWIWGNHERRIGKRTKGALNPARIRNMITPWHKERVHVSHWGHLVIDSPTGAWRITHARNYSVQALNVADSLVHRFRMHIIQHHEHHTAIGWDRYKHNIVINNGGFFDAPQMGYVMLDDSKMPNMSRGFTMLRNGYPDVFGAEPFTNYDQWLGKTASAWRPQ